MIKLTHYYGVHHGGTKDYSLYKFYSDTTSSFILIKRWGKVGVDGQVKIEFGLNSGESQFDVALKDRAKSGYDMRATEKNGQSFSTIDKAVSVLPLVHQRALTNKMLNALDPTHSTKFATTQFDPNQADRDQVRAELERAQREALESEQRKEQEEMNSVLLSNPNYGMF